MNVFSGAMVYVLVWWMVMFCMLPLNIQSLTTGENGTMPGAPREPGLKRKAVLTTIISTFVWLIIYAIIRSNLISFHDIALKMEM